MTTSADIARGAAQRLAGLDPALPAHVEARLQAGPEGAPPERYEAATLIALGALVVSAAKLAWDIYRDLRKDAKAAPAPEVVTRRVLISLEVPPGLSEQQRDQVIGAVVEEVGQATEAAS